MTRKTQVALFLTEAKKLLQQGRYTMIPRKKNLDALAVLGWSERHLIDFLMDLATERYVAGPEPDRNFPQEKVWIFGSDVDGVEYYIKLKIRLEERKLVCISFHEAKSRLKYPFERRE